MRLGMNDIRIEYEDLGFAAIWPMRAERIQNAVFAARGHRREMVTTLEIAIAERLRKEGLSARVIGREKHLYGIYLKMREKRRSFNEIMDIYGFRVVVDSVDACYRRTGNCAQSLQADSGQVQRLYRYPQNQWLSVTAFGTKRPTWGAD